MFRNWQEFAQWAVGWIRWDNADLAKHEYRIVALEQWRESLFPVGLRICVTGVFDKFTFISYFRSFKMANLQLTDSQLVTLSVQETDKAGNPTSAPLDAPPVWGSSDDTVLTVAAAADGLSCVATATGKLGSAQVNVSAAVAGKALAGSLQVDVVAGAAASLAVVAGSPSEKP